MKKITALLLVAFFGVSALAAEAKPKYIGMTRAKEIAHHHVNGTIKSSELEKEHGRMIYSFDIRKSNGKIVEVNIDAKTGRVVEKKSESAADEAKEKAADQMKKKP
jgi:uncharacterized membrane protein YkoI